MGDSTVTVAIVTVLVGPLVLLIAGLVVDVIRERLLGDDDEGSEGEKGEGDGIISGETVTFNPAYQLYLDTKGLLAEEKAEHSQCHSAMRSKGLPIPHD